MASDERAAVDLWPVPLRRLVPLEHRLAALLSPDEAARARSFHFAVDRTRFIAARSAVRAILAKYVGTAPREVVFAYSRYGKPFLPRHRSLSFSASRSGDLALVAVACNVRVGSDVERLRELDDLDGLVELALTSAEAFSLRALPVEERTRAFLEHWTRKEAYTKAVGLGIRLSFRSFAMSVCNGDVQITWTDGRANQRARWSLVEVPRLPGYISSVIAESPATPVSRVRSDAFEILSSLALAANADHGVGG